MSLIHYRHANIYQDDYHVLENVDFHVEEGEFVYIIGKVGSGKSSLLKTLYCELDLEEDTEEAEVLGRDLKTIRRKDVPSLRKEMGIIFQDFQLLHDRTVHKNMQFVLRATGWDDKSAREERIDEVLDLVGMADKKEKMPHELSGGEQQRIAIARAILNHPKIIIADEPTGNLDPDTTLEVMKLLRRISENGTAVLMATHNYTLMQKYPSRIANCNTGTVICSEME